MSDDESIISDEIDYRSDDGSGSYHASEETYEDDPSEDNQIVKVAANQQKPIIADQNQKIVDAKEATKNGVKNVASLNSLSDDDYNDYSAEFEETSAQSHLSILYSNDFEEEGDKTIGSTLKRITSTVPAKSAENEVISTIIQQQVVRLPGIDIASLQAEIALEEISKEVVRLRNQQRNLLHERRHIAREKKLRAETRRAQYTVELRDMKQQLKVTEDNYKSLSIQSESIQKLLETSVFSKNILQTDLEMKETECDEIKLKVLELQTKLKDSIETLKSEKIEAIAREENWSAEKTTLKAEILRASMLSCVVQQSLEANETRLAHERSRLPEEHRRLFEEQIVRNKTLEGSLIDRESALRAEEVRRFSVLEARAREASEDMAREKTRVAQELSEERDKILKEKLQLEHEKQEFAINIARERKGHSVQVMELSRKEAAFLTDVNNFKRAQMDFEAAKAAVQPMLQATIDDRETALQILLEAERTVLAAGEKVEGILQAEKGLHKMGREIFERETVAEELRLKYSEGRKFLQREARNILHSQKDLAAEQFRLHSAAIELASQTSELRHSLGVISKDSRISNAITMGKNEEKLFTLKDRKQMTDLYHPRHGRNNEEMKKNNNNINDGSNIQQNNDENIVSRNILKSNRNTNKSDFLRCPDDNKNNKKNDNSEERENNENNSQEHDYLSYAPSVTESDFGEEEEVLESAADHSLGNSFPPFDSAEVLNSMEKLNQISHSMQNLTVSLSDKRKPVRNRNSSRIMNDSIVFTNKNAAPYDFLAESDEFTDDFRFEGGGNSGISEGPGSGVRGRTCFSYLNDKEAIDYSTHTHRSQSSYTVENDRTVRSTKEHSFGEDWRRKDMMMYSHPASSSFNSDFYYRKSSDICDTRNTNIYAFEILTGGDIVDTEDDSNLRLAVDKAGEQASGLFAAAAKYGIYN